MTVSRVINGEGNVQEETRTAVAASIKALRYSPNPAARSLANPQGFLLGLCYASPPDAYLAEILLGSFTQANLSRCQLVLERRHEKETDSTVLTRLIESGVDGVILIPPLCNSKSVLTALAAAEIPAALVTSGRPMAGFAAVSIDDRKAAREMTEHLLSLGHRRIGFISGHPDHNASAERYRGFTDAMKKAGLVIRPGQVVQGSFTYQSGLEATEQLLSSRFNPTAIFASNDDMALAAIALAFRKGLDVPRDISIAGFDDTPMAGMASPALTAVHRPIAELAREAMRLLVEQLHARRAGHSPPQPHRVLDFSIIKRASTGPVRPRRGR
jgi:LacI family transcriptional regulator